jgi:hypothetical protein
MIPHRYGCLECEWDRLRKWAIKEQLIDEHDGPAVMVDRILKLFDRMAERIVHAESTIEGLKAVSD